MALKKSHQLIVASAGVEPARPKRASDFKSEAYTISPRGQKMYLYGIEPPSTSTPGLQPGCVPTQQADTKVEI